MKIPKNINRIRALITRCLTGGIGKTGDNCDLKRILQEKSRIRKILVSRPNGRLGNQLLLTPLIQELETLFPESRIDLFVKGGISSLLLSHYKSIGTIIQLPKKPFDNLFKYLMVWFGLKRSKYDLVINVVENSSSGRLSSRLANTRYRFYNNYVPQLYEQYPDYTHMAKYPIYNLRHLLASETPDIYRRKFPLLNIKLTPSELLTGKNILQSIVPKNKKVIAIYTFATGDKCYSKAWWRSFYSKLLTLFGNEYTFLEVLPMENCSQIDFTAPTYYSKDIRQIASFIANTEIFITADCGIMHLAASTDTPVVGLFSVTSGVNYQPYGNNSLSIDTNKQTQEDILDEVSRILQLRKTVAKERESPIVNPLFFPSISSL